MKMMGSNRGLVSCRMQMMTVLEKFVRFPSRDSGIKKKVGLFNPREKVYSSTIPFEKRKVVGPRFACKPRS